MRNALVALTLILAGTAIAGPETTQPTTTDTTGKNKWSVFSKNNTPAPAATSNYTPGSFSAEQWTNILGASARLRTLSQKAAKEYFFIAAGVDASVYRASLKTTMEQFDTTFTILTRGNESTPIFASESIAMQYDKAQLYWASLKDFYTKVADGAEPNRANFPTIDTTSTQLFEALDNAGNAYAKAANTQIGSSTFGQTITAVGAQRTLSQRLAKEFTLVYLGVFTTESQNAVLEGTNQFDKVLNGLFNGDSNMGLSAAREPSVVAQLNNIKSAWTNYRPLLAKGFNTTPTQNDVQAVAQSNDTLFQSVNVAFQTFQAIGKSNQAATVTDEQVDQ